MSDEKHQAAIDSVLREDRVFPPPERFSADAFVPSREHYDEIYRRSIEDPAAFWSEMAARLRWMRPWDRVLDWEPPFAKWFVGGQLNVSDNCLDRHLRGPRRNKAALIWVGEPCASGAPAEVRVLTYHQLHREVCRFANVLKGLGVGAGDRVGIYLPMIPEAAVTMLACARIGATHSVVFGGFSAEAVRDRMNDAGAKVVVTADGGYRRGAVVPLKANVDEAVAQTPSVKDVVIVRRTGQSVPMQAGRDHWWHEVMEGASADCPPAALDSEHPLFILYTSGTTGKPKGVVHSTAGYLLHAMQSAQWVFDLKDEDTYWCTADIGWVTGHSYVVYGILANGATSVMYEGAPNHPNPDRLWQIIDDLGVTVFYTAPTAIRAFIKWGEEWPRRHRLDSLRLLGTVGEPINPEAWMWYHRVIGKERCPIVDTWWQTETGGIMISPLPGATPTKPGSATLPLPGIVPEVRNRDGKVLAPNQGGYLVITRPWPGMLRTVYGDPERYKQQYWSQQPGVYFTGDGARRDADGYFWVMGRIDDVVNVSGHRLGTMEVESALVSHPSVAEAAVVGRPDDLKGEALSAFVTLESGQRASDTLKAALKEHVAKEIGAFARPDDIRFTDTLPKTRSGKIMRRLLRDIAAGKESIGDTTTLEDYSVLARLREEDGSPAVPLVLTNTLSGRKEELRPRTAGHVGVYWCGVTVYARSHVGHARAFVTADVLCRYLRTRGLQVTFVRNFTDIEDKIIKRAAEEGISTTALTEREIAAFNEDIFWLRCLRPTHEPRATTHIPDMLALVTKLIADGHAYPTPDGSVYFRVRSFPGYGKLSHQRLDDMSVGEEIDSAKEDPHDFALWKAAKPGEPHWPSPWGDGRPGWHIECSAMAARYLGQPFDVHGGGTDLIFPHHENEIAQSEAASGAAFANLWIHNGMLNSGTEKMSKSLGNIIAISELAKRVPAEALRLLYLGTHYRAPLDYSSGRLEETTKGLDRLYESLARADEAVPPDAAPALDGALAGELTPFERDFCTAMDDDLNAAKAVGLMFDRVKDLNRALDAGDTATAAAVRREIGRVGLAVGLLEMRPAEYLEGRRRMGQERAGVSVEDIEAAIAARNDARKRKDFKEADAIRARLKDQGIVLEDLPGGTVWKAV